MKNKKFNKNYPILSICIPTYNRPEKIKENLKILLPQLDERMEVVIRDDSSNFKTTDVVKFFKQKFSIKINYFKGNKIGLDAANLFLLEKCRGHFMWWLSDDDIIIKGGIRAAIKIIEKYSNVNFIWANFGYESLRNLAVKRNDGLFKDRNEVLLQLGTSIGLLSTYILKRSVAITGLDYGKKNIHGFSFASTSVVFWVLTQPGESYFLKGPYVLCKPTSVKEIKDLNKDKIVNNGFLVYGIYFHDALYGLKSSFDKKAVKQMLRNNFNQLWKGMIVAWIGGWEDPRGKRLKMISYYWYFYECWLAIILMISPKFLINILYHSYKRFIK